MSTRYVDFEITVLEKRDEGYPVRVKSPAGDDKSLLHLDVKAQTFQSDLQRLREFDTDEALLTRLGRTLYEALFQPPVASAWRSCRDGLEAGEELRIKLIIEPQELSTLPWELMCDPDSYPLASTYSIVRYLPLPSPIRPMKVELPLRILCVISGPSDWEQLDGDKEKARLEKALQPLRERGLVHLDFSREAHWSAIQDRLRRGGYHIFHYIGHGWFDPDERRGHLILENPDGTGDEVDARRLKVLFDRSSIRLAVLNGCETARFSLEPLMGVAPALVRADIPAVVAMQFEVPDTSAITFSSMFYQTLAEGHPVDYCVSEARKALIGEVGLSQVDWAIPSLWMRGDGVLFELPTPPPAAEEKELEEIEDTGEDTGSLKYMDDEALKDLLETHRTNLGVLEQQAAMYGGMPPLPIIHQIRNSKEQIRLIQIELQRRRQRMSSG